VLQSNNIGDVVRKNAVNALGMLSDSYVGNLMHRPLLPEIAQVSSPIKVVANLVPGTPKVVETSSVDSLKIRKAPSLEKGYENEINIAPTAESAIRRTALARGSPRVSAGEMDGRISIIDTLRNRFSISKNLTEDDSVKSSKKIDTEKKKKKKKVHVKEKKAKAKNNTKDNTGGGMKKLKGGAKTNEKGNKKLSNTSAFNSDEDNDDDISEEGDDDESYIFGLEDGGDGGPMENGKR